jgi:hypothetical protein
LALGGVGIEKVVSVGGFTEGQRKFPDFITTRCYSNQLADGYSARMDTNKMLAELRAEETMAERLSVLPKLLRVSSAS